ncbi:MAG: 2'-5' RNA ligase [Alphaproteobacteria bacterium]|nr:2'-5' RNA ligase [Alphaproteobacteria bacterium]
MTDARKQLALPGLAFELVPRRGEPRRVKAPRKFGGLPDGLFFALNLDSAAACEARQHALRLQAKYGLKSWPRPRSLLHVSLCSLGEYNGLPQSLVERAMAAAASVAMPPFEVAFDRVMSFKTYLVLTGEEGVGGVRRLEQALGKALEAGRVREPNRHFMPHITLIYDRTVVPPQRLRRAVRWRVEEFVLIHSLVGQTRHIVLKTFPLSGNPRDLTQ